MRKALLSLILFITTFSTATAFDINQKPSGFVNDQAKILDAKTVSQLESRLSALSQERSIDISVLTIASLDGRDIESFSTEVFRKWGLGDKDKNSGALLVIAVEDRKMRIEVGYGLEGSLTDAKSSFIVRNLIRPAFTKTPPDYNEGVLAGVEGMIRAVEGEDFGTKSASVKSWSKYLFSDFGFFIIFVVLSAVASWFAKSKSFWLGGVLGGVVGGVIGWFVWGVVGVVILGIVLGLLGLLFDYIASRHKGGGGGGGPFFFGGFGGGSSGGGFGGFGGGSSGGGGASSDW